MITGIDKSIFYDETVIAIVPIGFCYPGKTQTGDLPPKVECAKAWRQELLNHLSNMELILIVGNYHKLDHKV